MVFFFAENDREIPYCIRIRMFYHFELCFFSKKIYSFLYCLPLTIPRTSFVPGTGHLHHIISSYNCSFMAFPRFFTQISDAQKLNMVPWILGTLQRGQW